MVTTAAHEVLSETTTGIYAQELTDKEVLGENYKYIQIECGLLKGEWYFLVFTVTIDKILVAYEVTYQTVHCLQNDIGKALDHQVSWKLKRSQCKQKSVTGPESVQGVRPHPRSRKD